MRFGGLFTGIGAHHSAIERLGAGTVVYQSDVNESAVKAYNLIHGETRNIGDVTKISDLSGDLQTDVLFWSPPCQDISQVNPKRKGNSPASCTRSSLAFEIPRILENTEERERPTYLIMEEVPYMISKSYVGNFKLLVNKLSKLGYNSRWAVLNSADYGIAQSRLRLFMISSLNRIPPEFPQPRPIDSCLRDYCDKNELVPARYYLSEKRVRGALASTEKQRLKGNLFTFAPTVGDGIAHTITTRNGHRKTDNYLICDKAPVGYSNIRKLTPLECFRLFGYTDMEFYRISDSFSDNKLYELAGNSVVVNVYTELLKTILSDIKRQPQIWEGRI